MTSLLTWKYLSVEDTHKILSGPCDMSFVESVLRAADARNSSSFRFLSPVYHSLGGILAAENSADPPAGLGSKTVIIHQPFYDQQQYVLLDLFFHLLQFCMECSFSAERTSAVFGIVAQTHYESMSQLCTLQQSYLRFGELLRLHSVHRPPFASAIFSLEDVVALDEYITQTYYRHYKMYCYVFTPRQVATLKAYRLGEGLHEIPPSVPAQAIALSISRYEAAWTEEETARCIIVEEEKIDRSRIEEWLAQQFHEEEIKEPETPIGLQTQLALIKEQVLTMSLFRISELESKLEAIESKIVH